MNRQKLETALALFKEALTEPSPKMQVWGRRGVYQGDRSMQGVAEIFTCEKRKYLTDEWVRTSFPGVRVWLDPEPRLWGEYDETPPDRSYDKTDEGADNE